MVYGNGTIGSAVATVFAREGAKVFLVGRTQEKLNAIADQVQSAGGKIVTTQLDAMDEPFYGGFLFSVLLL